jgi:hypothetical protein
MIYRKHPIRSIWHRCLERQTFGTPRMYALSPSKSIKGSNYGEFLKDKYVLLMYTTVLSLTAYKYAPNLESLLTQQYLCVMCTLWSDNACVFTSFYSVKNANTQLIWSSENIVIASLTHNSVKPVHAVTSIKSNLSMLSPLLSQTCPCCHLY